MLRSLSEARTCTTWTPTSLFSAINGVEYTSLSKAGFWSFTSIMFTCSSRYTVYVHTVCVQCLFTPITSWTLKYVTLYSLFNAMRKPYKLWHSSSIHKTSWVNNSKLHSKLLTIEQTTPSYTEHIIKRCYCTTSGALELLGGLPESEQMMVTLISLCFSLSRAAFTTRLYSDWKQISICSMVYGVV